MRIAFETVDDTDFVSIIAENDEEAALLEPVAVAINARNSDCPAELVDNLLNGVENRILNGILELRHVASENS